MNFKPTLWKTIISLIAGVVAGYIDVIRGCPTNICRIDYYLVNNLWIYLIVLALIYIIWGWFEKKK
jgi:hypothetical protein